MNFTPTLVSVLAFVIFWIALYLGLRRAKIRGLTVYPLLLIYRVGYSRPAASSSGVRWRAARLYGLISVPLLAFGIGYFFYLSGNLFLLRYVAKVPGAYNEGFVPIIPGITVSLQEFIYILVAIGIAVLVHEFSHAVVARAEGVPIRNAGFILLAFIPAAFVEPDEGSMKAARRSSRIKVFAAGVAANVILGFLFAYILGLVTPALASGVNIVGVQAGSPAYMAGLRPGMVIVAVNGTRVATLSQTLAQLTRIGAESNATSATVNLTVIYNGVLENLMVHKAAGVPRLGIEVEQAYRYSQLISLLVAMYIVNLGLALVNAAPLAFPLPGMGIESDGGQALRDALLALGKGWERAGQAVELLTLLILLSLITVSRIALP